MEVESLYDQGTSEYKEDGYFLADPFYGVLDGVSMPYSPKYPPIMFDGKSGGEMVARTTEKMFTKMPRSFSVKKAISTVNKVIGEIQKTRGISLARSDLLAGVAFTIIKVNDAEIEVAQAGDCFALWVTNDNEIGITRNQTHNHDTEMNAEIELIMREVAIEKAICLKRATESELIAIRGETWNRFCKTSRQARLQDVNNPKSRRCFGLLNGQPHLLNTMWHCKLPRNDIQTLLLFSDGMVPWSIMKSVRNEEIAAMVVKTYQKSGLKGLLAATRTQEEKVKTTSYISFAEATAVAIKIPDLKKINFKRGKEML